MNNKRITPDQFADFIVSKTGKNLTCPICKGQEHYLHEGYDTFSEIGGEKVIGVPTITYKIEPTPTEISSFVKPEMQKVHFKDRAFYRNLLNDKAKTVVIVTCSCCSNVLFFDRERIIEWSDKNEK
ncbi:MULTISPECIES: hypothetical protein [Pasteurellaceae]|uniref:Uncharacterized protein n=3 Tax=Pasteurellaceae TaxID=712 RepID=A0AAQ4LXU8_9PAST|nr:hypothetical protein [Pasteurella atlantica]MBR0574187.1 hypothetical protein [Pasteurella atlantica]MDP8039296.1 hypothetical protein [Pasteurella atlantica]MDP8041388.1 hypothetical protein [Pasteurella atlantica]MDP8043524.1 hypothetical protein [Pasteurella atlantica]MDP8045558.1 hypothetical protein [Pasteurella atlantica]